MEQELNIADLLSHRAGFSMQNDLFITEFGHLKFEKEDTIEMFATLPRTKQFRSEFQYGNWNYALAALVLEKVSGLSWGRFLEKEVFEPLSCGRSYTDGHLDGDNQGTPYAPLTDGSFIRQATPSVKDGTIMAGAMGMRSCVKDLLILYGSLLEAAADQFVEVSGTEGLRAAKKGYEGPFRQVPALFTAHARIPGDSLLEKSYAYGWVRAELPGPLGGTGYHGNFMKEMPICGRGSSSRLVLNHTGSLAGYFSAGVLLPETQSAIVVLTNSISKNDGADWLSQLLLETLIDCEEKNDYVELARQSVDVSERMIRDLLRILEQGREPNTQPRDLEDYAGRYYNSNELWWIDVTVVQSIEDGSQTQTMFFCMKGPEYPIKLTHHQHNTFSWIQTWDDIVRMGRFPDDFPPYFLLEFKVEDDAVIGLNLHNDRGLPEPEFFHREKVQEPSLIGKTLDAITEKFASTKELGRAVLVDGLDELKGKGERDSVEDKMDDIARRAGLLLS